MTRRSYSSDEPTVEPTAEVTPTEAPAPPLTEKQIALNELDAYYGKVLGDLARETQEATAVHNASELRIAQIEAQKVLIDAEYAERKTALEGEPEADPTSLKPPTRWAPPRRPEPKPEPKPDLTPTPTPYRA